MELYYLPGSPFSRVVRIVPHELDLSCTLIEEQEFPPKLVKGVSPTMQVPTLVDGGRSVFGTRLIAEYLLTEYSKNRAPRDPAFAESATRPSDRWRDAQVLVALESLLHSLAARSYLIWTGVQASRGRSYTYRSGEA